MEQRKKQNIILVICALTLVVVVGGFTFAFFNYTRIGAANVLKVGRLNFISRQTSTINLTNVFPISSSNVGTDTDNVGTVVIEIEGDTDYNQGIEYLVSSENATVTSSSGKLVPISLDVTMTNLGTQADNYFTARNTTNTSIYKELFGNTLLGDQMLLVGYIAKNEQAGTANGIDGSITIKAYFDRDKIGISDTYDGTESNNMGTTNEWANGRTILTTAEWNSLMSSGVSFQIKVEANEGIWVNEKSNFEIVGSDFITLLDNVNTTAKYEILRNVVNSDSITTSWFVSTESDDVSISNGYVTLNQDITLDNLTIGATINGKTIYKNIRIDRNNALLVNLLDTVTIYEKEYVRPNNGEIISYDGYNRTDYIEVDNNKTLFFHTWLSAIYGSVRIVFFDENHNYVSSLDESITSNLSTYSVAGSKIYGKTISIPQNVKYMMIDIDPSVAAMDCYFYYYLDSDKVYSIDLPLDYTSTNTLNNVSIANFGDSIFGSVAEPNDIPSLMSTYFGSTNYNVAFGGTRMGYSDVTGYNAFSMYNLADAILSNDYTLQDNNTVDTEFSNHLATLKSIDFDNIDYVVLSFGTNDFNGGKPYSLDTNLLDTSSYTGATRYSINKLKEVNPNMKIILTTPIYRFWTSTGNDATNVTRNSHYYTEFMNATKSVAAEYDDIYVFDGYTELGIDSTNKLVYFDYHDGTHPNINGLKLYAYKLGKFIESIENQ